MTLFSVVFIRLADRESIKHLIWQKTYVLLALALQSFPVFYFWFYLLNTHGAVDNITLFAAIFAKF